MIRSRVNLLHPGVPGGYIEDPPADCQFKASYNPDPRKYYTIEIAGYTICWYGGCKKRKDCPAKKVADSGEKRRIMNAKTRKGVMVNGNADKESSTS